MDTVTSPRYSLWQMVRYYLALGTWGFGGPVALVSFMHRDLVEKKQWIREDDYKTGLALAQLAPGPLAAQLAIYMGYVHYRLFGATVVGLAFVIPSFVMVIVIGMAYQLYGGLPWMQAVFYGVGPCVIGIIAVSSFKLTRRTIGTDRLLWVIFLTLATTTSIAQSEWISLMIGAGIVTWAIRTRQRHVMTSGFVLLPLLTQYPSVSNESMLSQIAVFFGTAGAFVFGSGLAIVPFLYGGVVTEHRWLNERQFVDAVAVAMITPGPVVITVGFIGYLIAGFPGACVAAIATFVPCYLFTIIPAPHFKKYGNHPGVKAFVDGVTAAAIGAIAGAVFVMGRRTLLDWPAVIIATVTITVLVHFKNQKETLWILVFAIAGIIWKEFS